MSEQPIEIICCNDCYWTPGHVNAATFLAAMEHDYLETADLAAVQHTYQRWIVIRHPIQNPGPSLLGSDCAEPPGCYVIGYPPGRGATPVTIVDQSDTREVAP